MASSPSSDTVSAAPLTPEQRRTTRLCLGTLGVLGSGSLLGVAFSLYLVNHYPLLLVALSPLGRHVVLAAPLVDPAVILVVVVARRLLFYLACFHLGRALGPLAIPWLEARAARFAGFVRWLERIFERWSIPVVLLLIGPTVAALAGIAKMRTAVFLPLATVGATARMALVLGFAAWFRDYLEIALAWIDEYWIPGTVVMVTLVALYAWRRRGSSPLMED